MSRISTGTGDRGTTGLADGSRVSKFHPRVEVVGAVDEANDFIGLAISFLEQASLRDADLVVRLKVVQADLFTLGADVASPPPDRATGSSQALRLEDAAVARIAAWTDELEAGLPPLTQFILPGGVPAAGFLQVARSVVRRAERAAWQARTEGEEISVPVLVYLNRLSDTLFLAARETNRRAGRPEPTWPGRRG